MENSKQILLDYLINPTITEKNVDIINAEIEHLRKEIANDALNRLKKMAYGNKVPTAEEFYKQAHFPSGKVIKEDIDLWFKCSGNHLPNVEIMIEFAKLHVKAALEAAAENAKVKIQTKEGYIVSDMYYTDFHNAGRREIIAAKDSILNSYPENLIQ